MHVEQLQGNVFRESEGHGATERDLRSCKSDMETSQFNWTYSAPIVLSVSQHSSKGSDSRPGD